MTILNLIWKTLSGFQQNSNESVVFQARCIVFEGGQAHPKNLDNQKKEKEKKKRKKVTFQTYKDKTVFFKHWFKMLKYNFYMYKKKKSVCRCIRESRGGGDSKFKFIY